MIFLLVALFITDSSAHDLAKHFRRETFSLGGKTLRLWVADDDERRGRGLMFVTKLDADEGMLFVFDRPQPMNFWMKNTLIPLAIGFFDERCVLREIVEMQVAPSAFAADIPSYRSKDDAKLALEMNAKWFGDKIKPGAKLTRVGKKVTDGGRPICK